MTLRSAAGVFLLLNFLTAACSEDADESAAQGECPAVGSKSCPNDNPVTQTAYDGCVKEKSDPKCGDLYVDVLKCAGSNITCTPEGKTDGDKAVGACLSQASAHANCKSGN